MSTFLYAPGVRIFIKTEKHGTIDVSDDLIDYTVQRRSDGPSTLNFSLQNVQRKYDQVFTPNDEVIVELKRVSWVRVFTGLLNSVPLITMWPRVVAFSASCSLKRLQYWYWDPQLATSWTEATSAMAAGRGTSDSGITNVILSLLRDVVGWPENKAHIGAIPQNWFRLALPYAQALVGQLEAADNQVTSMMAAYGGGIVGGTSVNGSTGTASNISTQAAGIFKNEVGQSGVESGFPTLAQLNNAEVIIRVGKSMGASDDDIAAGLAIAAGESRWNAAEKAGDFASTGSIGLFQQMPSWGTVAQRTDPAESSRLYFSRILKVPASVRQGKSGIWIALYVNDGWAGNPSRAAQRSVKEIPRHQKFYDYGKKLVAEFNAAVNTGATSKDPASLAAGNSVTQAQTTTVGGIPMAADFVSEALYLVKTYPTIPYGSPPLSQVKVKGKAPTSLGCSSFVSWVIYNRFGKLPDSWNYEWAQDQYKWCIANGGKEMSVAEGIKTQGALLIRHPGYKGQAQGHIEISVGDGVNSVGARNPSVFAKSEKAYLPDFQTAVTMPWFDYTNAKNGAPPNVYAGGAGAGAGTAGGAATVPYSSTSGFDSTNVFDQMFGGLIAPAPGVDEQLQQTLALAFAGPRALLNDQPLLPYLKNLVNASMRSFCSAPNGDFMAWFPDYYGLWGTAAIMVLEPIEMQDFYVEWTDDYFVTHQYTVAGTLNYLDGFSGAVQTTFTPSSGSVPFDDPRIVTAGIASIDIPAIMYALFGITLTAAEGEEFRQYIYRKFGARPDFKEMDGMVGKTAELFSALYYFMRQWAYQYNANIPLTFMPELWPGMLIQVPEYNFQAYVTAVTHSGQMGEGGGHSTSVNIAAPARLPDGSNTHHLIGLPIASGMLQATSSVVTHVDVSGTRKGQRPGGGD